MRIRGITTPDVIRVISEYEVIEDDLLRSGLVRAGKVIRDTMVWVAYTALGDSLIVVDVSIQEADS